MPFKPVDQAIKVILGPCIDDGDFKAREESLAYNQAGMEIDVILEKHDGTVTTTAVTPTTSGLHDWAHTDQGYYELEIPASGGDYANDTEGTLTVVGYCTGVLPFRSASYDIVPEKVWNSLVEGSDNLEVDAVAISGDSTAADNLELATENVAAGYVASDLTHIHGSALTETAGQLAGRFKDFFDQSSAAFNVATALANFKATGFSTHNAADIVTALGTGSTLTDCATATGFSTHSAADVVTALGTGSTLTDCATATGFSTHTAANVVTALGTGSTLTDCHTATGFSTHNAADVVTALGTGSTLTDCHTATGFSTHSAADVVTALGTGSTLTDCATATGFSTHNAAAVVTALGTGSTLTACITATGFSTHTAANVVTAMQAVAADFKATGFAVAGDAMTLTAGERNSIADAVLQRDVDNVEATAAEHTLCTIVLAMLESAVSGTTWTIKRTDGSTTHATKTVTTDEDADPVTGVT